jgi:hypothetical protein
MISKSAPLHKAFCYASHQLSMEIASSAHNYNTEHFKTKTRNTKPNNNVTVKTKSATVIYIEEHIMTTITKIFRKADVKITHEIIFLLRLCEDHVSY